MWIFWHVYSSCSPSLQEIVLSRWAQGHKIKHMQIRSGVWRAGLSCTQWIFLHHWTCSSKLNAMYSLTLDALYLALCGVPKILCFTQWSEITDLSSSLSWFFFFFLFSRGWITWNAMAKRTAQASTQPLLTWNRRGRRKQPLGMAVHRCTRLVFRFQAYIKCSPALSPQSRPTCKSS